MGRYQTAISVLAGEEERAAALARVEEHYRQASQLLGRIHALQAGAECALGPTEADAGEALGRLAASFCSLGADSPAQQPGSRSPASGAWPGVLCVGSAVCGVVVLWCLQWCRMLWGLAVCHYAGVGRCRGRCCRVCLLGGLEAEPRTVGACAAWLCCDQALFAASCPHVIGPACASPHPGLSLFNLPAACSHSPELSSHRRCTGAAVRRGNQPGWGL